jgi:hypothetical protein
MAIKYSGTNSGSERVGFNTRTSTVQNVRVSPTVPVASDGNFYIRIVSLQWAVRAWNLGLSGAPAGLWAKVGISGGGLGSTLTSSLVQLADGAGSTGTVSAVTFGVTDTNVQLTTGNFTLTADIYTNSAGTTRPDNVFNTADDTRMGLNSGVAGDYYAGYTYYTVPEDVTNLAVASVTSNSATLTWSAPSNGGSAITGYLVRASSDNFATTAAQFVTTGTGTGHTLTGLSPNTAYKFRVFAKNAVSTASSAYGAKSNEPSATTSVAVTAPTQSVITTAVNSDSSISIAWTASTDNGNGGTINYKLYQKSGTGSYALIAGPSTTRTFISNGLSASTTYTYKVESINNTFTTTSAAVTATTQAAKTVPGVPAPLVGSITGTSVVLNWGQVSDGNDAPVTYYIERENTYNGGTYTQIATTTSLTYTATGLTSNTNYRFRIRAGNATGYSGYGSVVATTLLTPVWVTSTLPVGTVGVAYSATLVATGVQASNGYSVASGTLPAGLSLNATTGAITGTPTTNGTSNITFRATNANGTSDLITFISIGQATAIKVRNAGNSAWVPVTSTRVRNGTNTGWSVVSGTFVRNGTNTGWTNLG